MITKFSVEASGADAITGERIFPGERVLVTPIPNESNTYMNDTLTRVVKESTIVWLAQEAGLVIVGSDEGITVDAASVDGKDVVDRGRTPATRGTSHRGN